MAKITVGPVIGKVTEETVRIMIEADADVRVTCKADGGAGANKGKAKVDLKANRPGVLVIEDLTPDKRYSFKFSGAECAIPSRIKTVKPGEDSFNIGAVSCNDIGQSGPMDMWEDMKGRYTDPGNIQLLLHMGDQVYADNFYARSLNLLGDVNDVNNVPPEVEEAILETYRLLYRSIWGYSSRRAVLANVSNLMIWDDHEIRDDWGSRPGDADSSAKGYYVGTLARRVFREYQRQLWDDFDVDADPDYGSEHHLHSWGSLGVLFVDQRGGRSFGREASKPYLSTAQWDAITTSLEDPAGEFASVRSLLVVTPVPLVFFTSSITEASSNLMDDLKDHWAYGPHRNEQIEFIRALRRWQRGGNSGAGARRVLVLGGDVHIGCKTRIKHNGDTIFNQLITSPMATRPPRNYEFFGMKILMEMAKNISDTYSFDHYDFTNKRNYGVVAVRIPGNTTEKPRIDCWLEEER